MATGASCPARSTPRASCATTRSTLDSTRTRSSSSGAPNAATTARRSPSSWFRGPSRRPARGFTFSPGILVALLLVVGVLAFAAYLGVQLLRFAKPPTIAVTDPAHGRHRRRRVDDQLHAPRNVHGRRDGVDHGTRTGPDPHDVGARRLVERGRQPRPRAQPVRHHRHRPGDGQTGRPAGPRVHHRAVLGRAGPDADARPAGRRHHRRERRDPRPGQNDERDDGDGERRLPRPGARVGPEAGLVDRVRRVGSDGHGEAPGRAAGPDAAGGPGRQLQHGRGAHRRASGRSR